MPGKWGGAHRARPPRSANDLCGILDHFGYKVPDFSFIHESIWYDLGRFENWLIDRRGLSLGDVVPFRSRRLPGPNSPVSDGSQTSMSEGEEPFISASSTASKAASLPENLNGSGWEPSSSKTTAGDVQTISSIVKLDGVESFLAPLSKESMEKADILLRSREEASFTRDQHSIQSWLEKSNPDSSSLSIEVDHPLATPPRTVPQEETDSLLLKENLTARKTKEEPMSPGGAQPTAASKSSAKASPEEISLDPKNPTEASLSSERPQPIGGMAPTAAPRKSKSRIHGLYILRSALEIPPEVKLLAGSRKPKATSTPQSLMVRYNSCSCCIGGLPTGSIEMKELKDSPNLPTKRQDSPL